MSQITKKALEQSLKNLLLKKPLNKITINDITEDCGINRMTFYYHFRDIYDLVEWACLEDASKALEEKKIGIAYVTTPMEVTDAQKKQIEDRLLETTAYQSFRMHYAVDADLIGGMVIRIGDRVVDSSVRTKISELSRELSKIQLKVGESAS